MEGLLYLLLFALVVLVPIGALLGLLAFLQRHRETDRINALEKEIATLRARLDSTGTEKPDTTRATPADNPIPKPQTPGWSSSSDNRLIAPRPRKSPQKPKPTPWLASLKENWMVWLGGLSVGLAGIFMVSHSIALGLIGPTQQFVMALLSGIALHVGGEFLRRRKRLAHPVFAALAGGGSITLYAALLAGVHHFDLISAGVGLVALTLVSLSTMALALLHGPLLALMGLSGAYVVPILVGGDGGSTAFLLGYSAVISLGSLLLMRYVFRSWLWYATLAGALGWWFLTLTSYPVAPATAWYLAGLMLMFAWLPGGNRLDLPRYREAFVSLLVAWTFSIATQSDQATVVWSWLVIIPVSVLIPQSRGPLWYLPWGAVGGSVMGWILSQAEQGTGSAILLQPLPPSIESAFVGYIAAAIGLCVGLGLWQWRSHGDCRRWVSLVLLAPMAWLTLAWILLEGYGTSPAWAVSTLALGGLYGLAAWQTERRNLGSTTVVFALSAAHICYSLASVMAFREASLTLALSVQFVSLAWLAQRYRVPELYWLLKLALALVVARLTFNPWIQDYNPTVHWTLWTYGGALIFAAIASRLVPRGDSMRLWLEAATLHLLVLFLGAELRYWLYDGDIFAAEYSMTEAALNALLWGGLSMTYQLRARTAESLTWLYQLLGRILLLLSSASYATLLLYHNPWWSGERISDTPILNILLLAYGAPVVIAIAMSRLPLLAPPRWALGIAAAGFLVFTGLEIRQLWQGADLSLSRGVGEGELYTYSVVGMVYAILTLMYARWGDRPIPYKAGMAMLGLVIAKIFLIDMAGLQGLWRVAAFMGLGLSLLGLAWLYRNARKSGDAEYPPSNSRSEPL